MHYVILNFKVSVLINTYILLSTYENKSITSVSLISIYKFVLNE